MYIFWKFIMPIDRWKKIHEENANPPLSYAEYFKNNLISHLTKENDPNGEKNQPDFILKQSKTEIGRLSRIFDAFAFPVPSLEQMKGICREPNGLRNHMQGLLEEVLPTLLNGDGTALNPAVIEAIGPDNYEDLKKAVNGDEEQIAKQFVDAIFVSYGQRILDNVKDEKLKLEAFSSILTPIEVLAKQATLKGLSKPDETADLSVMQNMINNFTALMEEAQQAGIKVENANPINSALETANEWLDPEVPGDKETKIAKVKDCYDSAVNSFIKGVKETLENGIVKPEEAGWFRKMLRFISGNEKLWQKDDEKRYDRQMEILPKIANLNSQLEKMAPTQDKNNESKSELENESAVSNTI